MILLTTRGDTTYETNDTTYDTDDATYDTLFYDERNKT